MIAIIGSAESELLDLVAERLEKRDQPVRRWDLRSIGTARLTLAPNRCLVDGTEISASLFASSPTWSYSDDFEARDRRFCDTETKAMWLGISAHPAVVSVNRLDEDFWFGRSEWSTWRQRFAADGIDLATTATSTDRRASWMPWSETKTYPSPSKGSLGELLLPATFVGPFEYWPVAFGACLAPGPPPGVVLAAASLAAHGSNMAVIVTDANGRLIGATSDPDHLARYAGCLGPAIGEGIDVAVRR